MRVMHKPALAILLLLSLTPAMSYAGSLQMSKKAKDLEVRIQIDRNPPVVGTNNIEIEISDMQTRPVTDAKVLINYYMPPMPRMAPMNYTIDAKEKGKKYRATMNLIMAGPWIIAVKITTGTKTSTAKFNIDAR